MPTPEVGIIRTRVHVTGLVQGVGFRPFVWREATSRGLSGWVGNDSVGVVLEVEGDPAAIASLLEALTWPPTLARVDDIHHQVIASTGVTGFDVRSSVTDGSRRALVSPDSATCADCSAELRDRTDRRFRYPFVNCTSCGPRFTIVESVPYDRSRTTMSAFPMCGACAAEYGDPADRRFHAEPVCCPRCGPHVRLHNASDNVAVATSDKAVALAVKWLHGGKIVAIKGLGGYHLAVDATNEKAVAELRRRKTREDRPFALMVLDEAAARDLCHVKSAESDLLTSAARPIVVLSRKQHDSVAPSVAPGSPSLGIMLPYTPLHLLLLEELGGPIVLTSGNASDEPIAFTDSDARSRLANIADAYLMHDREIRTRVDDSVMKVVDGRVVPIRRSRGYVPNPVHLPQASPEPVLACGAALKSTFCIVRGRQAFVSQHVGDLGHYAALNAYVDGIEHFKRLLDIDPVVVAHDLHPDYASTQYASDLPGVDLIGVQHHHAHIAACLADNGVSEPVIGVAFDGVGLGADGTAWGGEFLVADLAKYTRVAHLSPVPMPGGDAAARQPWRMAASHLDRAFDGDIPAGLAVTQRQGERWTQVMSVARTGVNAPLTTSVGRLFDAVSALLGVRDVVTYEGQAAVELEYAADASEPGSYDIPVSEDEVAQVQIGVLIRSITDDLRRGVGVPVIAARFHNALADMVHDVSVQLRSIHDLSTVALSGGVFQNSLLLSRCLNRLEEVGFTVLTHRDVPPNDGGISLGQAAVASALLKDR